MNNYTPIDPETIRVVSAPHKDGLDLNILFLALILITLVVMAALLFVLIHQRVQQLSSLSFLFA